MVAFLLSVATAGAPAVEMTVTTTADVVNGDVSSPAALLATPGPDGISLREAIEAANAQPGPHTIGFAATLAGQTIAVGSVLVIRRSGVQLIGPVGPDGKPAVTLDGVNGGAILAIVASDVTLRRLRFIRSAIPLWIVAGQSQFATPGPAKLANIRVEDNVFSNESIGTVGLNTIMLGIGDARATGAVVTNVTVGRNTFVGFRNIFSGGNAGAANVLILARGTNNTVEGVSVLNNYFADNTLAVEIAPGNGSGNRIAGTVISGNTVNTGFLGVAVNPVFDPALDSVTGVPSGITATTHSVIEDTVISGNAFLRLEGNAILVTGGVGATQCAVRNTRIVNNLVAGTIVTTTTAISIRGGEQGGTGNVVEGVHVENNTIAHNAGGAMEILQNVNVTGNRASEVHLSNSILWQNQFDFTDTNFPVPGTPPDSVRSSIITTPVYVGVNGNLSSDPKFVNTATGDFRLQAGSPALDAAQAATCPLTDRLGVRRPADGDGDGLALCDIGAHERGPGISLAVNGSVFRTADTLAMTARVSNPLAAGEADFYAGALLPDGVTLALLGPSPGFVMGALTDLAAAVPLAAAEPVAAGVETGDIPLLSHTFSGAEPAGSYIAFALWTKPNALRDGVIDAGDIIAIATQLFFFVP